MLFRRMTDRFGAIHTLDATHDAIEILLFGTLEVPPATDWVGDPPLVKLTFTRDELLMMLERCAKERS